MKRIFETVKSNILFRGITLNDFESMFNCLNAKTKAFKRGETILGLGEPADFVGLVLDGKAQIINEDINGHTSILTEAGVCETFGEVFACAGIKQSPVTVLAMSDTEVLLMDYKKVITACTSACPFHAKLIENMLMLVARKNLLLNQKNEILSKRTVRDKLIAFFDMQRGTAKTFTIPFNREEMAQYLCADRSAVSNELSKMRNEGLINFRKNSFEIMF